MRRLVVFACLLAVVVVLALASSALGHNAGPCNDSGDPGNSDYAQHHIVPVAESADLGAVDHDDDGTAHNPGTHMGYSACNPSGQ